MRIRRRSWTLAVGLLLAVSAPLAAQAPVVRAVLFYSPTCPHCHRVINEDLPPLVQRYGDRLMIVGVDVTTQNGQMLFRDAANHYGIPLTQLGVPLMVVDDQVLMGDQEIPQRLPGIIEAGLARGGTSWPALPLLHEALVAQGVIKDAGPAAGDSTVADSAVAAAAGSQPTPERSAARTQAAQPPTAETPAAASPPTETPAAASSATKQPPAPSAGAQPSAMSSPEPEANAAAGGEVPAKPAAGRSAATEPGAPVAHEGIFAGLEGAAAASDLSMHQRFALDPLANSVALIVLLVMIGVATAALSMVRRGRSRFGAGPSWWIPLLAVVGLGIALYLSFVEVTGTEAVCGPVGDCNTVQQSIYAHVLGMPVGVLGAMGYVAILLLWAFAVRGSGVWRERAAAGLWAASFTGVLFSIYLTFLEPFVIGATCAWCVGSAVVMTLLLVAATGVLDATRPSAPSAATSAAGAGVTAQRGAP